MRSLLSLVAVSLGLLFFAPSASAGCSCFWIVDKNVTCTKEDCTDTVAVKACSGIENNCKDCTHPFDWVPCCTLQVGSARSLGDCGVSGPLGLFLDPISVGDGFRLVQVYAESCSGSFVTVRALAKN